MGRLWRVVCDCGNEAAVPGRTLASRTSRSCGCLNRERLHEAHTKHGMANSPIYKIWTGMRQRCDNPDRREYPDYGGRGIRVCERWEDFANFYADMGDRPGPKYSLDRIDVDGNYEPGNVRWATRSEQNSNKRPTLVCRNGHPRTPDNTLIGPDSARGTTRLRCRDCDNASRRRFEERKAASARHPLGKGFASLTWDQLGDRGPLEVAG